MGTTYIKLALYTTTDPVQDPTTQLEQLARRQSDVLAHKLGEAPPELPSRSLPYGSEGVKSPTYVAQHASGESAASDSTPRTHIEEPSFQGPGALFEKGETFPSKMTPEPATEEEKDVLET